MKLILTSNGISSGKVEKAVLEMCGGENNISEKRVLVIRSSRKNPDAYAEQILEELKRVGFSEENISFANPFREDASEEMRDYDFYFSAGGNTFVILKAMKEKGYDKLIREVVSEGKIYLGASAGTIILQKDIEIAGVGKVSDDNYIGLEDLSGLEVIDFEVYPHYEGEEESEVSEYENRKGIRVERLEDGNCLVVRE